MAKTFTYEYTDTHILFLVNGKPEARYPRSAATQARAHRMALIKSGYKYTTRPSLLEKVA
jgi:hypothetical protein